MFDIQRFGDNDTITSANELSIIGGFNDGDTRTFKLKNPRTDIADTDIALVSSYIENNNLLIGDKAEGTSTGINSATIIETTKTKLDLT